MLVLGACRRVAEGAEQSGAVWERKLKGTVHSFHMAAPQEFAGEFSGQTALLVLQSSLAQKVAGWLWAGSLAQPGLPPNSFRRALGKAMPWGPGSCELLKQSSYAVEEAHHESSSVGQGVWRGIFFFSVCPLTTP